MKQNKKTFTATIRVDIRGLASLAGFLNQMGIHKDNKSKLASYGLQLTFEGMAKRFPVETHAKAIKVLSALGYGDATKTNTLFHKALMKELAQESFATVSAEIVEARVLEIKTDMAVKEAMQQSEKQVTKTMTIVQDLINSGEYLSESKSEKPSEEELTQLQAEGLIAPNDSTSPNSPNALTSAELEADRLKHATEVKTMQDGFASGTPEIATDP